MPKYLLIFEKSESVRWLGHLDILRTFERAIRRAGLPVAFSTGFNPRERIAFASALSTGVTAGAEPAVLELTDPVDPVFLREGLNGTLPPGIRISDCQEIPETKSRDLLNSYDRADYEVVCACAPDTEPTDVENAIRALLERPQWEVVRAREGRSRTLDIRPYVYALTLVPASLATNRLTLAMTVAIGEGGNAKPPEVVALLAETIVGLTVRRSHRARLLSSAIAAV
jgi:radical SAM-linked protein